MPTLYVYLYENGKKRSFDSLSGQEMSSIEDALRGLGDDVNLDVVEDDDGNIADYAKVEVEKSPRLNKKIQIRPENYGVSKWGKKMEVEYRTTTGGRRGKKTRSNRKRTHRKTRR
jgi:hypothetical protein